MATEKEIDAWVKEGIITKAQADRIRNSRQRISSSSSLRNIASGQDSPGLLEPSDSQSDFGDGKSTRFVSLVSIIGAVLVFIGVAWLIAKNWHQIPDLLKVTILVASTLASFYSGVMLRHRSHIGTGRALIVLGSLFFVLSLFLISQIYHMPTTTGHYALLLFLSWSVIIAVGYLLDSKESISLSLLTFFPWMVLQYQASVSKNFQIFPEGVIFSFIILFLSAGALLFGLSTYHRAIGHKYANIYKNWTVFYFLLIFFLLSFQSFLPLLSEYSFDTGAFSFFLVIFTIACFICLGVGAAYSAKISKPLLKETYVFLGIILLLLILTLSTKIGAGKMGECNAKSCYDYRTSDACMNAPSLISCRWNTDDRLGNGYCSEMTCYTLSNESECKGAPGRLNCLWENNECLQRKWDNTLYEMCSSLRNQKDECQSKEVCKWNSGAGYWNSSGGLVTSLWLLWIINNIAFIGFIVLMLWYGQSVGSESIINLALKFFILEVISRYIGFWMDFRGYFAFSVLAILGGLLLIFGAILIPKFKKKLLEMSGKVK